MSRILTTDLEAVCDAIWWMDGDGGGRSLGPKGFFYGRRREQSKLLKQQYKGSESWTDNSALFLASG